MSVEPTDEPSGPQPDLALPAAVRQAVVGLAAEVVAMLPPAEVPPSLRAVARFAPAKRVRLGGTQLAAVVDSDEAFRGRLARVVAEGSPELAATLAAGGPTGASDPADLAVAVYLLRPDGWPQLLAGALHRLAQESGGREPAAEQAATQQETERLRAELAALRAGSRGEPGRIRDAVASAVAESAEQARDLQRRVRTVTGQLRQAERERDAAVAAAAEATDALQAARRDGAAELAQAVARAAAAERAVDQLRLERRREVRGERDLADARLGLLVDTVVTAAQGLRRELALPPSSLLPADEVAATLQSAGREVRDVADLDAVLALPRLHLIVDGYNVTKTGYPELALAEQRGRLLGQLAALAARIGAEVTIAFDGSSRPPLQPQAPRGVRVLFSAAEEIADDLVRRLVAAEPDGRPVLVATSDRAIVRDVLSDGAYTVAAALLLARLP